MCAFSPTDDIQVWCTKLPYEYEFTAPAALDGIVYLHGGGTPGFWQNSVVYSMSNMIVSYDISTGLPQWLDLPDYSDSYIRRSASMVLWTLPPRRAESMATRLPTAGENTGGTIFCPDASAPISEQGC